MLVGGSPGDHRIWVDLESTLATDYHVRLFDPLDHGLAPDDTDATLADLEADLLSAVESEGDVVLVGFSLGAYLAARVASRSRAVTGVVLLAGFVAASEDSVAHRVELADKLERGDASSEILAALAVNMWLPQDEREQRSVEVIGGMLADVERARAVRGLRRMAALAEPACAVTGFDAPGFIAHSERDTAVPLEQGRALAKLAPAAKLVVLDSGSHVIPLSHTAHVLGWIRTASARRAAQPESASS